MHATTAMRMVAVAAAGLAAVMAAEAAAPAEALAGSKPHILVVLIDDFGWANGGWHRPAGFNETPTPHMRQLIDEGIELDRHYVFKFCSPTRSAVLSGRRPTSVNVNNLDPSYTNPADTDSGYAGIPYNMTTMGEKMKMAGYATHAAGKWDVGMATPRHAPKGRGFDSSIIYFHHAEDPWTQMQGECHTSSAQHDPVKGDSPMASAPVRDLWQTHTNDTIGHPAFDKVSPLRCEAQGPSLPFPANETGCTYDDELLTSFVIDRIRDHSDQNRSEPLFLYWATRAVHGLQQVPKLWFDRFSFIPDVPRRKYAAMVAYIDEALGNVTQVLKETGLYNDTFIWLMADNGGALGAGNNYPHKGGKFSNWEGGIRVNSFISGGVVPESLRGTKSEHLTTGWDVYATACELAGIDKTDSRAAAAGLPPVDSISQVGLLSGNATAARDTVVIGGGCYDCGDFHDLHSNATVHGLISDERESSGKLWKLLIGQVDVCGWTGPLFPNSTDAPVDGICDCGLPPEGGCLFDLESDPSEHEDVAAGNPSVRERLIGDLLAANKTVFTPNRGVENPLACEAALGRYNHASGSFWGPFLDLPSQ